MHCAHSGTAVLSQESFSVVPNCTQQPHRPSPDKNVLSSVAFLSRLAFFSKPKRESCTSSTDRAPWHGNHDVRSHGLDQGNGTVDGLGPAARLLVKFGEEECNKTYPDTLQLCSRLALRSSRSGNCHKWWTSFNAPIWTNPIGKIVSKQSSLVTMIDEWYSQAPTPSMTSFLASRPLRQWCSHSSRLPGWSV
jgi:hypothetical protein